MRPVKLRRLTLGALALGLISAVTLVVVTSIGMQALPDVLTFADSASERTRFYAQGGERLNVSYSERWNYHDQIAIHSMPTLVRDAFIVSEDKRFATHNGIDWLARFSAAWTNLRAGTAVRGASTISEQVVRMIHPRARTPWSRWLEGFEAMALEDAHSKLAILEFYVNQLPYKAQRRGIVQAAHYYFDRDLSSLNEAEMLALVVLVRSPKWFDPSDRPLALRRAIVELGDRLRANGSLNLAATKLRDQQLALKESSQSFNTSHFLRYAKQTLANAADDRPIAHTTIDLSLQNKVQSIVDSRLQRLADRRVENAAALVVDHERNEILAWVVGDAGRADRAYNELNGVIVRRQPGSTLKPLLYAAAISKGWSAATQLDDSPLEEMVGEGLHRYDNYSRAHYGPVSLREALGNSLNIPAVRAVQFVGPDNFLNFLRDFGMESLRAHPNIYGDGLALGNGEISLFELVQAYSGLARMGDFKRLSLFADQHRAMRSYRVLSEDIASLIADILSDPGAREKEFGRHSVLNLPFQTAVKTGTSSDYRDAWAVGFNDKYTVGVWLGNMNYRAMDKVTGASGPALALRAIFNELNKNRNVRALYLSDKLEKRAVCIADGLPANADCAERDEWFSAAAGSTPAAMPARSVRLRKPSPGLRIAQDPRIPDEHEYFQFALSAINDIERVEWFVDDELVQTSASPRFDWKLVNGSHTAYARISRSGQRGAIRTDVVEYKVE